MTEFDARPLLPWTPEAIDRIRADLVLVLFGPPPSPDAHPSMEMLAIVDYEMLRRYRLWPGIYHRN